MADATLIGKDEPPKFFLPVKLTAQYAYRNKLKGEQGIGRIEEVDLEQGTVNVHWTGEMQEGVSSALYQRVAASSLQY